MRARVASAIAAILISLAPLAASAADTAEMNSHWTFAPFVGYHVFDEQWGTGVHRYPDLQPKEGIHLGARLGYVWAGGLGLELAGGYTPTTLDSLDTELGDMTWMYGSANLIYSPAMGRFGSPFLSAGFGGGTLSYDGLPADGRINFVSVGGDSSDDSFNMGVLDMAAGWTLPLGEKLGLRLEARNLLWIPNENFDNANVAQQIYGAALTWGMGGSKPKDDDGDGVSNKRDKCPATPAGATVNADGCPTDADGDGVFDGLDQCANTPKGARVNASGCPTDADGDKVWDGLDKCEGTPAGATVNADGCPTDADGDGVFDGLDQCPNSPTGSTVDAKGCPMDSDGDGVSDGLDKCPGTASGLKVDAEGCPIEVSERETELLDTGMIRLQDINFETGKSDLLPESYGTLDIVGQLLTKWPELKIEIGGHTDSRGSNAANQQLSESRANSVKEYLLGKFTGLNASQYSTKGYGELKPVAPNTSAINMSKNRRVEFVVLNKDVLKKEQERRKLLQK